MAAQELTPMIRLALLAVCIVAFAQDARGQVIFQDNFNSGASPLWGNEIGQWRVNNGIYEATRPTGRQPNIPYSSLPFELRDFSIQVDINDIGDGGLFLRSRNNQNGVLLVTGGDGYWDASNNPQAGKDLYWAVFVNGQPNPPGLLSRVPNVFVPGVTDATIRVDVTGNNYLAYVNGQLISTLTNTSFTSGRVALYDAVNPQQTFDNVILTVIPEPSGILLGTMGILSAMFYCRPRKLGTAK
jgi:hypothetical protein